MTLDLGHLREYLFLASNGVVPELTIAKEWLAAYQSILIFFGTVWRFYTNEGRSTRDGRGGHTRPMFITIILAWGSFAASCGLFVLICWTLLDGLPSAEAQAAASFPEHLSSDIICLQVLVLVWCGYPVLSMLSRLSHWGVDGDKYSATWSVIKDVGFAFLDVTSKGGLAIFFVLKASWVDAATENALVAAGKAHLNLTVG